MSWSAPIDRPRRWRARAMAAALLACVLVPMPARAHQRLAHRSIVVQIEDDDALLLVTWTAPTGLLTSLLMARAALTDPRHPARAFEDLLAARALATVTVTANGKVLAFDSLRHKLTLDASSQQRHTVTVLVEVHLPPDGVVEVTHHSSEATELAWSDKTSERVVASCPVRQGRFTRDPIRVVRRRLPN